MATAVKKRSRSGRGSAIAANPLLYRFRKNGNRGQGAIWVGRSAAIVICMIGIILKDINYLGDVLGFLLANELGKRMGWQ